MSMNSMMDNNNVPGYSGSTLNSDLFNGQNVEPPEDENDSDLADPTGTDYNDSEFKRHQQEGNFS